MSTIEQRSEEQLDVLLQGWRQPKVAPDFTASLLQRLPVQERPENSKLVAFPAIMGPGSVMGAAAAVLLLLIIGLAHSSRVKLESDLVELDSHSDEAISDLYRLIHLEELASMDDLAPEDADMALLLFATGG